MATLNLGRIKPVFRGAYAGGTAYVVDDIVTSGGETFICILASTGNATSNATYWTKLAQKGTDGTDVGATLTTQGDILYRDGSGLQRLPKGTANQVLKMNAGATAPEYGNLSSDFVKLAHTELSGTANSITMSNVFSTTYDFYEVLFQFRMDTTSQVYLEFEKSSDSSFQNANYYFASGMAYRDGSSSGHSEQGDWNYGNFRPHENQANSSVNIALWHFRFVKPMEATETRWQHHISMYDGSRARDIVGGGWNGNAEAHSGFKFTTTSGNMRAGTNVTVYAVKHA